jgi:PAS domain S-box-containing protein
MEDLDTKRPPKGKNQFLAGGGEMGALIREKDWSENPVGPVEVWPQSLRTTLSILLNSRFPMFLWWGPELICFYNDAYRPSLGQNGKHPAILGMGAKEAWPEIWDIIKPLIDQVLTGGEAVWREDQLIPIYRNGKIEDVYWTFSYSPVNDESGKVAGVLVTCSETTEKVNAFKNLEDITGHKHAERAWEESEKRFRNVTDSAPVLIWMAGTDKRCNFFNTAWLNLTGRTTEQESGNGWATAVHPDDLQKCLNIYITAFDKREEFHREYRLMRYDGEYRWVSDNGVPRFTKDGTFEGYIGACIDIHERIINQNTIRESEERLKESTGRLILSIEGTQLGIWDLNLQTFEIVYSPRVAQIFGYPAETKTLTHHKMREHIHPDDIHTIVEKAFDYALETGTYYYQARIIHPDKTIHWIRIHGKVIYDDRQVPVRMQGTVIDITDSQVAEENVRNLAAIVHSSDDAIISKNLNGIIATWNAGAERIFGYTAEEMIGQPLTKLIPADRTEEEPKILAQLKKGERVDHFETKRITKDNKILDVSLTISPVRDIHGNIIGASKIARDITKQKEAERLLIASEEKFRLLADSMPQFIWTGDTQGNLNYFNKSIFDYSGLTPEQLNKDGWIQIVHPDDRAENLRVWMDSVNTGKGFIFDHRFRRHDGEYRWQLSRAIPQKDAAGNIQMWVGTSTDIQEIKELDQQKDYFISMASHELKTPITSMKGYVQILQSMYLNSEDTFLKKSLTIIDKQIGTLTNLISDLLDLSKIKTGSLLLNKEYFQINELIREVVDEIEHIHPDYSITFSKETEALVYADRKRIGQVMINFLTNAIKYSPVSRDVKIESCVRDSDIVVSVKDSGIGINKQDQEKIFERFYRVEGKNEKTFPGFGIGLFIASEIIHRHSGKIGVKSEPAKGSVFYFSLPFNNQS